MMMNTNLEAISWRVPEEEYRQHPAYSYSLLAKYERGGFNSLSTLFDKVESPSLTFGSIVDCLVTGGEDEFNRRFVISTLPDISDTLKKIATTIKSRDISNKKFEDIDDETIDTIAKEIGYYTDKRYDKTRVSKVREGITEYYNKLLEVGDKTMISQEEYNDAMHCYQALRDNKEIESILFASPNPFIDESKRRETFYQLKFKTNLNQFDVKCMVDAICVDHGKKEIIPIDLKTSSKPEWDFFKSFVDWNYDIQARLYWYILKKTLEEDPYFKDFTLKPYHFIVVNKKTLTPMVWVFNDCSTTEEVKVGEHTFRDIFDIVYELDTYLNHNYDKPIGMGTFNSLEDYLCK